MSLALEELRGIALSVREIRDLCQEIVTRWRSLESTQKREALPLLVSITDAARTLA